MADKDTNERGDFTRAEYTLVAIFVALVGWLIYYFI